MPPLHNRPKITRTDVDRGYVVRYFVQNVSKKTIVEVDQSQYESYTNDPYYYCIQLQWSVGGNDVTTTLASGVSVVGTQERNQVVIDFYDRKMPGLRKLLRNPLEYFSGTVVTQYVPFVAPFTPAPPISTDEETVPGAVILHRTSTGKVASFLTSEIEGVSEAFDLSKFTSSVQTSGYVSIVGGNALRIGRFVGGTAYTHPLAMGTDLRNLYLQTFVVGASSGIDVGTPYLYARRTAFANARIEAQGNPVNGLLFNNGLYEYRSNNSVAQSSLAQVQTTLPTRVFQIHVSESTVRFNDSNGRNHTLNNVTSSAATGAFQISSGGPNNSYITYGGIHAMTSPYITIQWPSPSTTWYARLLSGNGTVLATSSFTATDEVVIDTFAARFQFPSSSILEVRESGSGRLLYFDEPEGRIWGGDTFEISFVEDESVPPIPNTELLVESYERTQLGRIVAFQGTPVANVTSPFSTAGWLAPLGITIATSSGNLTTAHSVASTTRRIPYTASGEFTGMYVQHELSARSTGGSAGAMALVSLAETTSTGSGVQMAVPGGFSGAPSFAEVQNNSSVQIVSSSAVNATNPVRSWVGVYTGSAFAAVTGSNVNLSYALPSPLSAVVSGSGGIYHSAGAAAITFTHREFMVMRNHLVTVRANLPVVYVVQLLNASNVVLASATSNTSGIATIDCYAARIVFPNVTKIRIRNVSNDLLQEIEPTERIWGGDIWDLTVTQ